MTSAYCAKDNSSCNEIAGWVFSVACWMCSKEQKGLLRRGWVGFESPGLGSSRIKAQGRHFGGGDCWSWPESWKGCGMMCGQESALFHSTFLLCSVAFNHRKGEQVQGNRLCPHLDLANKRKC